MRERDKAIDYSLTRNEATLLAGLCQFPAGLRREVLESYAKTDGADIIGLLAQFVGLANSVVQNCHDSIEMFAIVKGDMHPSQAEHLNLPTVFGAANGALLADSITQDRLCDGCAFRLGTLANQSPATTSEADWCGHPGEQPFMCHMDLDANEQPTRGCAGFAQLRANRKAAA